jgi:hypothetical protein
MQLRLLSVQTGQSGQELGEEAISTGSIALPDVDRPGSFTRKWCGADLSAKEFSDFAKEYRPDFPRGLCGLCQE